MDVAEGQRVQRRKGATVIDGGSAVNLLTLVTLALTALATGTGCDDGNGPRVPGPPLPFRIDVDTAETHVKPNESRELAFWLRDAAGQPVPSRALQFSIVPADKARGATLSVYSGITEAGRPVPVQVIGGQPTEFSVRASATSAPDSDVQVRVTAQDSGPVAVAPEVLGGGQFLGITVAVIRVAIVENMACVALPTGGPFPPSARSTVPGREIVFGTVAAVGGHAVVGQGLDAAGIVMATGCVDLSGLVIRADTTIRLALPLTPPAISPAGNYTAMSQMRFSQEPPALRDLRGAWARLDACDLDPARIWLDCTVDALAPATPLDPLDCKPSAADEAAFDGKLSARRGLPIAVSPDVRCRQELDGAGHASLEKQIAAIFTPSPQLVADFKSIAAEGAKLLDSFRLHSAMTLWNTSLPGRFQLDHRLTTFELLIGTHTQVIDVPDLGGTVLTARFVPIEASRSDVTIDRHGFTLRLGSLTRVAFMRGALLRRGHPEDATKFVEGVFATASYLDRNVPRRGCAALSALVCPQVGGAEGCLADPCAKGLTALGQSLSDAFAGLDGGDLDFFLQGGAPLLDRNADGLADAIGYLLPAPGVWKALVRLRDEQIALAGFFAADRITTP